MLLCVRKLSFFKKKGVQYDIIFDILTFFCVFSWLLSVGDAPYCTPEQYKECADPALGKQLILYVVCVRCSL